MRRLARATGLLVAALSLQACQDVSRLDLLERDGRLLIWTEREWKWFLIPERPRPSVGCIEVWSGRRWMWHVEAQKGREIKLPIAYGETRPGLDVVHPPQPLVAGQSYRVRADKWNGKSFQLSGSGQLVEAAKSPREASPDEAAASEQRDRRFRELRGEGMSEVQAYEVSVKEHPGSLRLNRCERWLLSDVPRS